MLPNVARDRFNVRRQVIVPAYAFLEDIQGLADELSSQSRIIGLLRPGWAWLLLSWWAKTSWPIGLGTKLYNYS